MPEIVVVPSRLLEMERNMIELFKSRDEIKKLLISLKFITAYELL